MCFGSPSPPPPPDPKETAQAQFGANVGTALAQQQINFVDQTTPTGTLKFSPTGEVFSVPGPDGTPVTGPKYQSTVTLSPTQQAIFDRQQANTLAGLGVAGQVMDNLGTTFNTPFIPGFNEQAFLEANPTAAQALSYTGPTYTSALDHFVKTGANEGRLTGWDEAGYLAKNADVAAELAKPTGTFDANYYLTQNQDVLRNAALNLDPTTLKQFQDFATQHYNTYGVNENRLGAPAPPAKTTVDPDSIPPLNQSYQTADGQYFYYDENSGKYYDAAGKYTPHDVVAQALAAPPASAPTAAFDPMAYLTQNQDVLGAAYKNIYGADLPAELAQIDPALLSGLQNAAQQHWSTYGQKEGRAGWDAPDYTSALDHFLRVGAAEGRMGGFDEAAYLGAYGDVQNAVNRGSATNAAQYYLQNGGEGGVAPMPTADLNSQFGTTYGQYWNPATSPQVQTTLGDWGNVQRSVTPTSQGVNYGQNIQPGAIQDSVQMEAFRRSIDPAGAINQSIDWGNLPGMTGNINIPGLGQVNLSGAPQVAGGFGAPSLGASAAVAGRPDFGPLGVTPERGTDVQTSAGMVDMLRNLPPAALLQMGIDPRQLQTVLSGFGNVQSSLGDLSQFTDPSGAGQIGDVWDIQRQVNLSGVPGIPGQDDFSADRQRVEEALFSRLDPQFQRDRQRLETQLANQGIGIGTEAYDRAIDEWNRAQTDARMQTILAGGQEQSRLFGMGLQARQQGVNELFGQGQFANAAQGQGFEQALARAQFGDQALQGAFNRLLAGGQFANAAQEQQFKQALAQGQFGNEALMNMFGQDVTRGQFANAAQNQQFQQGLQGAEFYNKAGMDQFQQMLENAGLANQAADISGRLGVDRGRLGLEGQRLGVDAALGAGRLQNEGADILNRYNLGRGQLGVDAAYKSGSLQNEGANILSRYGIDAGRLGLEGQELALQQAKYNADIQNQNWQNAFDQALKGADYSLEAQGQQFDQNKAMAAFENAAAQSTFDQSLAAGQFSRDSQAQGFDQATALADLWNRAQGQESDQGFRADQFANQAQNQLVTQDLARQAALNAAQNQAFGQAQLLGDQQFNQQMMSQQASNAALQQMYANALQGRQQGINEQMMQYTMPVQMASALMGMGGVQFPQFGGVPQTGVSQTDITGPIALQYQGQVNAYNQQVANDRALMSAIFGGLGTVGGGWAQGGFKV